MTTTVELPEGVTWTPLDDSRTVFQRVLSIIDELPAIGKTQQNVQQKFMFRGHDDVMNALNPLLAKHGVFIVPNVVERVTSERTTARQSTMYEVNLHVRFTFFGAGGDSFAASGWGEGTDMGDKSTSKAMTMAFKYVLAEVFALATAEVSDADAGTPEETARGGAARSPREEAAQRPKAEFDPGKSLLPEAIAVKGEDDATAVQQAQRDLDSTQDWAYIEAELSDHLFRKHEPETGEEWGEWWKRLANAVAMAWSHGDLVSHEEIQKAYAWAFKGFAIELKVPEPVSEEEMETLAEKDD